MLAAAKLFRQEGYRQQLRPVKNPYVEGMGAQPPADDYIFSLFLEQACIVFREPGKLGGYHAANPRNPGVQHFLLPKNFLKPYFRLIILSNFPYFYVVCAVCI